MTGGGPCTALPASPVCRRLACTCTACMRADTKSTKVSSMRNRVQQQSQVFTCHATFSTCVRAVVAYLSKPRCCTVGPVHLLTVCLTLRTSERAKGAQNQQNSVHDGQSHVFARARWRDTAGLVGESHEREDSCGLSNADTVVCTRHERSIKLASHLTGPLRRVQRSIADCSAP